MTNPFVIEGTKEQPLELTVPALLAYLTPPTGGDPGVTLRVATDGYLIALVDAQGDDKPVVTAWTGEGQGKTHGRPERWRQNYHRAFAEQDTAERRFHTVLEQHGGAAEGGDR